MVGTEYFSLPDGQGCRMAYRILRGSGARDAVPLLLVNGLSAVMDDWSPLFETLGASRTVVISDHRGIGESTLGPDWDQELSLESMGLDLIHLAHHLGFGTIDLLGFSMGGHIVQAILSSPDVAEALEDGVMVGGKVKVRKAVLCATMTKLPRGDADLNRLNKQAQTIADKKKRDEFITMQMMKLQYHQDVLGTQGALQTKFERRLETARRTKRPAHIIALQFLAIQAADLRPQLHRIPKSLDVLVIHGHKDRMVRFDESNHILSGIKHAQRLPTPSPDFAHFWYDYFDIHFWSNAISSFLDSNPSPSAKL